MAAGDTTQGRRRPDGTLPNDLKPGEYSLARTSNETGVRVWLCSPRGEPGSVHSDIWTITIEDNETITVHPSIFWNRDNDPPGWHGYLQQGVWSEV